MSHHRPTTALVAAGVLALGLAACGDDAPAADAPPASATEAPSASAPTTDASGATDASGTTVEIDDFGYDPETVTVAAGSTVTWTNEDATRHTVTAGSEDAPDPDRFDEEVTEQGQAVEVAFDEPGTYAYYCVVHPFMTGTVEVTG